MNPLLIEKYNVAVPRYTSYPTVPHWQQNAPTQTQWLNSLKESYAEYPELSLYIHLPFCEALCTYCGCNKRITKNHTVENPYIDAVLKEWKIYLENLDERPTIKEIHLGGGTPTFFDAENLKRLISTILEDSDLADGYEFSFEAHPNSTSSSHLQTLYELGFRRISIGVQDVSPNILKAINRKQTADEVRGVTTWARALGYTSVNYDIIYGLPFQKPSNIMDTAKFIAEQRPDRIAFYSYAHVPWKSASQRAFTIKDVPSGVEKNELYDIGRYLLEMEDYKAVGMDHFCLKEEALYSAYTKGEMHRNFMGYTPNYTKCSIALGASSISDSWSMYVQNEKHVESYQQKVANGELPIIKGHQLSNSEMMMRKHILNLMCNDKTRWTANSQDAIAITPFLSNLDQLVADGLVKYSDSKIQITEMGKFFIRNICSSIDPIFQASSSNQVFSKAI
ncbi:MAG: oxygen-independent coproporphyrinogen III oxidase [Saprospiraceae bacterium]|nr:oxygen-independent coproporphyrinogen III oxidase [Saprospiraceae bacterium]